MKLRILGFLFLGLGWVIPPPVFAACCKCSIKGSSETLCLTDDMATCGEIVAKNTTANPALANVRCDTPLDPKSSCRPLTSGGSAVCKSGPIAANVYAGSAAPNDAMTGPPLEVKPPKLNISVPNLKFSDKILEVNQYLEIPFLAQYISAMYSFLLGITTLAGAIMIVYGGTKYILSQTSEQIQSGQEEIKNAVIGLILVFSSVMILRTINPATSILKPLRVKVIEPIPFIKERLAAYKKSNGQFIELAETDKKSMLPPYTDLTLKTTNECTNKNITQELRDAAMKSQKSTGVPAAVTLAQFGLETGFGKACLGKEGKKYNCFGIKCVVGGKYEGRETPLDKPDDKTCPDTCTRGRTALNFACFQDFGNFDEALTRHASVVKKSGWEQYNGSPEGFAHFVENKRYAEPGYSSVLIQIMKDQCLL